MIFLLYVMSLMYSRSPLEWTLSTWWWRPRWRARLPSCCPWRPLQVPLCLPMAIFLSPTWYAVQMFFIEVFLTFDVEFMNSFVFFQASAGLAMNVIAVFILDKRFEWGLMTRLPSCVPGKHIAHFKNTHTTPLISQISDLMTCEIPGFLNLFR